MEIYEKYLNMFSENTAKLLCKVIENYANNVCLYKWLFVPLYVTTKVQIS